MTRLRVLLVEDSEDDAELVLAALVEGGFDPALTRVETREEMHEALSSGGWDVVISDYNLPRFDALSALSTLRQIDEDLPFIIVSGCMGEEIAVSLMKEGASDFVMKDRLARLAPAIERELKDAGIRREHRKSRDALLASEKLLKGITSSLGEGVIVLDESGRLVFMNPEAERLLGWTHEELRHRDVHGVIHSLNQDGLLHQQPDYWSPDLLMQGGMRRTEEDVFWCKDGSLIPVSVVASAMVEKGRAVAAVIAFQDITDRKQAEWELIDSSRRLRELTAYFEKAREEERTRIARELHDELGQMLMGIKLDAKWLESNLPPDIPAVPGKLASMFRLIDETVDAMRRVAADLRPVMLDDLGLVAAVEWLTEEFGRRTGIAVSCGFDMCEPGCCIDDQDYFLEKDLSTAAFRIVQECLTNVARHAEAEMVEVKFRCRDDKLMVSVADDGKGMPEAHAMRRNSFGMLGMQERARGVGGSVEFHSKPGEGVRVEVILPIKQGDKP